MLTVFTSSGSIPLRVDDYYIKELESGLDELVFSISIWDDEYKYIQEETSIREQSDGQVCDYLIKAIDGGVNTAQIKAQIDLDEWRETLTVNYKSESATLTEIVSAVAPDGWTVTDTSGFTYRRTIALEAATPFDVLEQCRSTFKDCTFRFDNINKSITIINALGGQNLGAYATRELNLKGCEYKGKSTDFATRLYAYGKDGLSFASINDGKPYVDNNTYSNRVVCAYMSDERFTVAENLLADATAKLAEMAVPSRSFDCDVVDLAAIDPGRFGHLSFPLFSIVGLIDETRSSVKIDHRVVGRWRYPYLPQKNRVMLSTVAPRIQAQVSQVVNSVSNVNSEWAQKTAAALGATVANITSAAVGASGGSVRLVDTSGNGTPDTLYIANSVTPSAATVVWKFDTSGWSVSTSGYSGTFVPAVSFLSGATLDATVLNIVNLPALGTFGGCVRLVDTDNDGAPDALYVADNATPSSAVSIWKLDSSGWSYSSTGYSGTFSPVMTFDGKLRLENLTFQGYVVTRALDGVLHADNLDT